jgi:hypothetical protein
MAEYRISLVLMKGEKGKRENDDVKRKAGRILK